MQTSSRFIPSEASISSPPQGISLVKVANACPYQKRSVTYEFTLEVSGIDTGRDNYEDALFEAGRDDALIAVIDGTLFLDFHRAGASFEEAIKFASRDVETAGGKV